MTTNIKHSSKVWLEWLGQLEFLKSIPDDVLRLHVGFAYYLCAPIQKDIWRVNQLKAGNIDSANALKIDYEKLIYNVPNRFWLSEPDAIGPLFSISHKVNNIDVLINSDVLRMQADVSNLQRFGLLNNLDTILEVGGGYGHLANAFLEMGVCKRYLIIDFDEILEVANRWTASLKPAYSIHRYQKNGNEMTAERLKMEGLHLIPVSLLSTFPENIIVNLMINMNSFCEMTREQVESYVSAKYINYEILYSNNREKQICNMEMDSVTSVFANYGRMWPNYELLQTTNYEKIKKKVILLSRNPAYQFPQLNIDDILGITGQEMPSL